MANSLIRFITGEPPEKKIEPSPVDMARLYQDNAELTAFQMEIDQALMRSAIRSVVEVEDFRRKVAGDDPYLNSLIRPMQQVHAERLTRRLGGRF